MNITDTAESYPSSAWHQARAAWLASEPGTVESARAWSAFIRDCEADDAAENERAWIAVIRACEEDEVQESALKQAAWADEERARAAARADVAQPPPVW